jgi:hypothetical protein
MTRCLCRHEQHSLWTFRRLPQPDSRVQHCSGVSAFSEKQILHRSIRGSSVFMMPFRHSRVSSCPCAPLWAVSSAEASRRASQFKRARIVATACGERGGVSAVAIAMQIDLPRTGMHNAMPYLICTERSRYHRWRFFGGLTSGCHDFPHANILAAVDLVQWLPAVPKGRRQP